MRTFGSQTSWFFEKILLLQILLLIGVSGVDSALEEFPNNTVSRYEVGKSTSFKCKSDLAYELKWFNQPNGTAQRQNLANGRAISKQATSYCNIQNDEGGEFNLILKIQEKPAQTYTCYEPTTNEEKSAELVIIEPISFEKGLNESHVILGCSVKFKGNWAPELELSHNGSSITNGVVAANQNVSSLLVIPRNNDRTMTGNYNCTIKFSLSGKPQQTTDKSVPSYFEESSLTINMTEIHPDTHSGMNPPGLNKMLLLLLPLPLLPPLLLLM